MESVTPAAGTTQRATCGAASESSPFASRTVTRHLVRGAAALILLVWALVNLAGQPVVAVLAGIGAVVALRGCPMCWTVGLVETVLRRLGGRS